jgi:GTP-binding protein EngB required for normal cell division
MLDHYKEIRTQLIENIDHLTEISSGRGNEKIAHNLKEIREKLIENRFHLVVLGQFKRGKSTFINSIIGDKILPTSIVPLTSIVTMLKYGQQEEIEVIFEEGNRQVIAQEELPDYVTERGNPKNVNKVKQVEIAFPSAFLKDGVFIIDTPGVGSTFENNTEMTYNYLPKVDAALFLLAVDPPISQSEIEFLKDVQQYVEKIFFIQNKIDYLNEEERQESMAFSKQVIEEALGRDDIDIHPLSAKLALEAKKSSDETMLGQSRLPEFDAVLGQFLLKAKGKTVLRSALNGTRKLLSDEELTVQLENQAIETPLEQLEQKIHLFQEKMDVIKQDREDIKYYFEGEIQRVIDVLDHDLQRLKDREIPKMLTELEKRGKANKGKGISEYIETMESTLHHGIVRTFDSWVIQEEERLNEQYARVSKRLSESTNEIIEAILKASEELFDLKIERFKTDETIVSDSNLYYLLGDPPKFFDLEGAFDFFSKRIVPRSFSHNMVLKDLKKKLPGMIDKNCGRVRWDFMDRIKRSFMNFRWDLNLKIDATEQGIRQAIDKAISLKKQSAPDVEKAKAAIKGGFDKIRALKTTLKEIELAVQSL